MDKVKVNGSGASPVFQFLKVRWMLSGWLTRLEVVCWA